MGEEDERETKAFFEGNIDEILEKNSRIAKYSLLGGACSFSKQSFVSNKTDQTINLDDPNFWEKVLKETVSKSLILKKELQDNLKILTSK